VAADPQLYRISDVLGPAVDALVAARPKAKRHIYAGRYGDVLHGWAAQAALVRARLAREIVARRLGLAEDQALVELCASEYFAELDSAPQPAIGEATIRRVVSNGNPSTSANFGAGVIPAGKRFRLVGNTESVPPLPDAIYESTAPVICGRNDTSSPTVNGPVYTHTQTVIVPVRAVRPGPEANVPNIAALMGSQSVRVLDPLFDAGFAGVALIAAGGTNGQIDEQLRALARALSSGEWGPTSDAGLAGALSHPSIRRAVWVNDPSDAVAKLFVADESWATSLALRTQTLARLNTGWLGFGARVALRSISNQRIRLRATIVLRSDAYLSDATDIAERVTAAAVRFFDDRQDFWTWTAASLEGALVAADLRRRILSASAVTVEDQDGNALAAPAQAPNPDGLIHYWLAGNAVELTFDTPS
jgi:hypothetical protein